MNFFKLLLFSLLCVSSSIISTAPGALSIAFQPVYSNELTLKPCAKLPTASQTFIVDSLDALEAKDHQSLKDCIALLQNTCKNTLKVSQARKTAILTIQLTCTEENVSVALKLTARKADGVIYATLMLFVPDKADKEVIKAFEIFCRKAIPSLSVMQKHVKKIFVMSALTLVSTGFIGRKSIMRETSSIYRRAKDSIHNKRMKKHYLSFGIRKTYKEPQKCACCSKKTPPISVLFSAKEDLLEDIPGLFCEKHFLDVIKSHLDEEANQLANLNKLRRNYNHLIKTFKMPTECDNCTICGDIIKESNYYSTKNCTCTNKFHEFCILRSFDSEEFDYLPDPSTGVGVVVKTCTRCPVCKK